MIYAMDDPTSAQQAQDPASNWIPYKFDPIVLVQMLFAPLPDHYRRGLQYMGLEEAEIRVGDYVGFQMRQAGLVIEGVGKIFSLIHGFDQETEAANAEDEPGAVEVSSVKIEGGVTISLDADLVGEFFTTGEYQPSREHVQPDGTTASNIFSLMKRGDAAHQGGMTPCPTCLEQGREERGVIVRRSAGVWSMQCRRGHLIDDPDFWVTIPDLYACTQGPSPKGN